jgi:hypothetical protein
MFIKKLRIMHSAYPLKYVVTALHTFEDLAILAAEYGFKVTIPLIIWTKFAAH